MPGSGGSPPGTLQVPLLSSEEPAWSLDGNKVQRKSGGARRLSPREEVVVDTDSKSTDELCEQQYQAAEVRIMMQEKEWGELSDSSGSSLGSAVPNRQERYAAAARGGHKSGAALPKFATVSNTAVMPGLIDAGQVKGALCLLFFIDMNLKLSGLIMLSTVKENRLPVLGLSLIYLCIVLAQVQLALSDRYFLRLRREHWSKSRYLQYAFSLFVVVGALGFLQVISLLRAVRFLRSSTHAETIVSELDCQDGAHGAQGGNGMSDNIRVDCGAFFLVGVPLPFLGAWLLLSGKLAPVEPALLAADMLMSAVLVVVACIGFDYQASRAIQWLWNSEPHARGRCTRMTHVLQRVCEVLARMLFGLAVVDAWPQGPCIFWLAVWMMDCLMAGYFAAKVSKSARSRVVAFMVAALLYVADLSRYIDENGFARAAKRLSTYLGVFRALEVVLVSAVIVVRMALDVIENGPAHADHPAIARHISIVVSMVVLEGASQLLASSHSTLGRRRQQDLFTAAESDDCELLRYLLDQGKLMDKNTRSRDHAMETPLHAAIARGHSRAVELLLQEEVDVRLVDASGDTPLHAACRCQNWEAVELLIQRGQESPFLATKRSLSRFLHCTNAAGKTAAGLLPASAAAPEAARALLHLAAEVGQSEDKANATAARDHSTNGMEEESEPLVEEVDLAVLNRLFGPELGRGHTRWRVDENCGMTQVESLTEHLFAQCIGERVGLIVEWRSERRKGRDLHVSTLSRVKTLGAGSFGKVIQVKDEATAEEYALKIQLRSDTQKQAVREAQALAHLDKHPCIVRVVHIFHTRLYFGILMELCDRDLNRRIIDDADGGLVEGLRDKDTAARYTLCMSLALHHLHTNKIIFRDLKPENVLVTRPSQGDHAKLTDFGLACRIDRCEKPAAARASSEAESQTLHRWHSFAGTRGFIPQEVFEPPQKVLARLDVRDLVSRDWYALGCTLLLMLFGETVGNKVKVSESRSVLLPPHQEEIAAALEEAEPDVKVCPTAVHLVRQLTKIDVASRGDFQEVRSNPFVQKARAQLEVEAVQNPEVSAALQPLLGAAS